MEESRIAKFSSQYVLTKNKAGDYNNIKDNTAFRRILTPASGIPRLDSHTPGACTAAEACRRDKLQGNRSPCCNTDRHTVQRAGSQTETKKSQTAFFISFFNINIIM